jgi:hypothetical protein
MNVPARSLALFCFAAIVLLPAKEFAAARLRVTDNHRYLQYEDGKSFFYLGDTAWELFHRLNREEATLYLTNRANKGFSVIQAVVLPQLGGANAYGDSPLVNDDPTKPNEAYFRHVDFIVSKAEELGLFIGMLPTWGSNWALGKGVFNPANAKQYGRFLGARYKEKPIIWILGGDRSITNDAEREIIDAMAAGLAEGDGGSHLKTFHPIGPGLSSIKLNDASWLDFNMFQSSHASKDHDNGLYVENDYALKPVKPTMDGEPRYEGIPVGFYLRNASGIDRFDDYDVRQAAYWSLLAGACGHTYGNNNVWQMYKPTTAGVGDANRARDLFAGLILNGPITGGAKIRAARASDGSFALIYTPRGESFTLNKHVIKGERLHEYWFDPRYGVAYFNKAQDTWGIQTYTPPTSGRGNDWVLVLTNEAGGYKLPGATQ